MVKTGNQDAGAASLVKRAYSLESPDEQAALYRDWATTYDDAMVGDLKYASPRKCAALLARHLGDKTASVLDIGCGTGLAGNELAAHGYAKIDGIDISQDMLSVASQREIYRNLIAADLLQPLTIATASYSGAICTGTFTHAHVGAACLDEITRILKPGAIFAFTVHRDVYEKMGFDTKLAELSTAGAMVKLSHHCDAYYDSTDDPEGHYFAYQKA